MIKKHQRFLFFIIASLMTFVAFNNCGKPIHTVNELEASSKGAFKCTDRTKTSLSTSYLLSKDQYQNTIEDIFNSILPSSGTTLLASAANEISTLYDDIYNADTNQKLSTLSSTQTDSYFNSAYALASAVVSNNALYSASFGSCGSSTCIDVYLNGLAKKIFRRPLTLAEQTTARNIAAGTQTYKENLKALLAYHLISPAFLWRLELGYPTDPVSSRMRLTDYEVATRISYTLTDSVPDKELFDAADTGSLSNPINLSFQIKRLIFSKRGKNKVINNILRWAKADSTVSVAGLPSELTNGILLTGLEKAMVDEAKIYIDYIVFNQNGTFKDLLTSKASFATHVGLAKIYNHSPVSTTSSIVPATFGDRRQGLLMRAPAMLSAGPTTDIILRGVKFQKNILCNDISSPTVDISSARNTNTLTPQELLTVTNRTAITFQTSSSVCMSCHSSINPTGYALESFDSIGAIRTKEKIFNPAMANAYVQELPLQTTATVSLSIDQDVNVQDAYELISEIAKSEQGAACFTRKAYRYFYEKSETANDDCQLQDMQKEIFESQKPIVSSLEALLNNTNIYYKDL